MITSNFHQRLREVHQRNKKNMPADVQAVLFETENILRRSDILTSSVQVGQKAPDFEIKTTWCDDTSLSERLKTGPVILSFYRGFWCSTCREEIQEYLNLMPQLERLGRALPNAQTLHYFAICPQQIFSQNIDRHQHRLITDVNLDIAKKYGIVYEQPLGEQQAFAGMGFALSTVNKMNCNLLNLPSTFVIDQQGIVMHRNVSLDYRQRQDPNELFEIF